MKHRAKPRKQTSGKSSDSVKQPELVPQPHGGFLQRGGTPGNPGGGRPKDEVRAKLLEIANTQGLPFLSDLMNGRVTYRLVGICPECGHEGKELSKAEWKGLGDSIVTSIDHRIKGLDTSLKYGAGTKDELEIADDPRTKAFVSLLLSVVRRNVGSLVYETIETQILEALKT